MTNSIVQRQTADRLESNSLAFLAGEHLQRLLASEHFDGSARSRDFLCFIVEEALCGRGKNISQSAIATRVFGRTDNFDATMDPVVRVQAGRLRRSLERYYLMTGDSKSLRIELPKGGYTPVFVTPTTEDTGGEITLRCVSLVPVTREWPTVLVPPFDVAAGSVNTEVQGRVKDALILELYRYRDVCVVRQSDFARLDPARQASVRFELRGRLRRKQEDWFVSACLIDRWSGQQLWGDEYHTGSLAGRWSSSIDDVARVIAARIGAEYGVIAHLLASEHASETGADARRGYGAILSCYQFFFSRQGHDLAPAVDALKALTSREPEIALAWNYLARLYQINYAFEMTDLSTPIDKAVSFANQAVTLEPTSARIRCSLASALLCKDELQAARYELDQALQLNADSLAYREMVGWLLALAGDWDRGIAVLRDAMVRNPYCLPHVKHGLWADHLRRGQFEEAYIAALEYRDTGFFWRELMMICCLGHLGRLSEARASIAELLRIKPNFVKRGRTLIGYYIKPPELRERIAEGFRKAGLPLS